MEKTFSITFKSSDEYYSFIDNHIKLSSSKVLASNVLLDTEKMYEEDKNFKALVKLEKKAKDAKLAYINNNLYKYK
jgi:hypothetical protein